MTEPVGTGAALRRALVLAWAPPHKATRSAWLARELGLGEPRYVVPTRRRGLFAGILKYPGQFLATAWLLATLRPRLLLVQSPPSFATWVAAGYTVIHRSTLVIDAHSDAMERVIWLRPFWMTRWVARRAAVTIVTNDHWARTIEGWGGRALVVASVATSHDAGDPPPMYGSINAAVVNTWAPDEPIGAVIDAAATVPDVHFHVTGRAEPAAGLRRPIPPNVHFTGFLTEPAYHGLLKAADVVICLTTRNYTMQNGATEAMSHGTPVITSDWPVLREYFDEGTIYVGDSPEEIAKGVRSFLADPRAAREGMQRLRSRRESEWQQTRRMLIRTLDGRAGDRVAADGTGDR